MQSFKFSDFFCVALNFIVTFLFQDKKVCTNLNIQNALRTKYIILLIIIIKPFINFYMTLLKIENLYKVENSKKIVDNINLSISTNEKIGIIGSTGSGKTTLLKMIAGFIEPSAGEIFFNQKKVIGPFDKLIAGHSQIAYLNQHFELRTNYKVEDVLEMANKLPGIQASNIYKICKIDYLFTQKTNQLSGGERQRVALAIQLSTAPQLLILDEPFSNLDALNKMIIKDAIEELTASMQFSCILVSHDSQDILQWANKIYVMQDGKIIQTTSPLNIYNKPFNEYCAALTGDYNIVDVNIEPFKSFISKKNSDFYKAIIRPEQFKIESIGNNGIVGYIKKIIYYGSFYILVVLVELQEIRIRIYEGIYSIGEPIYFTFNEKEIWYI